MASVCLTYSLNSAMKCCTSSFHLWTVEGLGDLRDGRLEQCGIAMRWIIGLHLLHAPQPVVAWLQVREPGRPLLSLYEEGHILRQELLHPEGLVHWHGVLNKHDLVGIVMLINSLPPHNGTSLRMTRYSLWMASVKHWGTDSPQPQTLEFLFMGRSSCWMKSPTIKVMEYTAWHRKCPRGSTGSPHWTDSFWDRIFTWNRWSKQCWTRCSILSHSVTVHCGARAPKRAPRRNALFFSGFAVIKVAETFCGCCHTPSSVSCPRGCPPTCPWTCYRPRTLCPWTRA